MAVRTDYVPKILHFNGILLHFNYVVARTYASKATLVSALTRMG